MHDPNETAEVELSHDERQVLDRGMVEWGGPAHCTEKFAAAMGFDNIRDLIDAGERIADDIESSRALTRRDWTRALLATEIVFISDILGSGYEWPTTTGLDDGHTLRILRELQLKLATVVVRRGAWETGA